MPPLHLLIKPVSGRCNMRCAYCFYADEMAQRGCADYGRMSQKTLRAVVTHAFGFAEGDLTLAFQGGEPTLAGLGFYRGLVDFVRAEAPAGLRVHYAIQTNGLAIDEEWAAFLAKESFLVGLSLDGPREVHDAHRLDAKGQGTFSRVMQAAALLKKHRVDCNILTVVTARAARSAEKIYRFYQKNDLLYQQYIPCLDKIGEKSAPYSLTAERYGTFLKTMFDLWYADVTAGRFIYNRTFENWVQMLAGLPPESCGMSGVCSHQFVLEADGSVYPCDFYVLDGLRLGNLVTDSFETIENRREALGFVEASRQVDEGCRGCEWYALCRGGCRRHREPMTETGLSRNRFCEAYRAFFPYAVPRLAQLAERLRRQRFGG